MRKNPYNKNIRERLPFFMQGPSKITALTKNKLQENIVESFLEKNMVAPTQKYEVGNPWDLKMGYLPNAPFTMVTPPALNRNITYNPENILNVEMGQTEVTQNLFYAVMGWNESRGKYDIENPVENVTWFDCLDFCNKLSDLLGFQRCYTINIHKFEYVHIGNADISWDETAKGFRLPTEHEWESFAKAGTQNEWSGTNVESELEKYAWLYQNSSRRPYPVGQKLPNEWGLYDMTGNVNEWCWDTWIPGDTDSSASRCLKGGSWQQVASEASTIVIDKKRSYPDGYYPDLGFRICRTIK